MQTKKVVSVLLAGVTTLSMAMPVLAANGDPNLVVTPDTLYFTPIEANSSVTLGLMPANAYYQRTGFDSADAGAAGRCGTQPLDCCGNVAGHEHRQDAGSHGIAGGTECGAAGACQWDSDRRCWPAEP